jgi:deazaflavin-dependent oxidoreductase (nitroreductase family)
MYPGGRPTDEAKAIHRRFVDGPIPRLVPVACVLEVPGRKSGALTRVPLVIVRFRGTWYLVSMFGDDANWVRNVRAADGHAVLLHGRRRPVRLVEVPPPERAPIIKRYLMFAMGARPHVPVHWRAPRADFEDIAAKLPVFAVHHVAG